MNDRDVDMITRTVMGEAGDQPDTGKAAVAHVILNRVRSGSYGDSASKVVTAPYQFEPWQTRRGELTSYNPKSKDYQKTKAIVDDVVAGKIDDPTGGATHFYSPVSQRALGRNAPSWAKDPTAVIGGHNFYAPNGPVVEDILGSWGKKSAPAQADDGEDLLGSWMPTQAAPSGDLKRVVIQTPKKEAKASEDETLPEATNRILREHQGDTLLDKAARVGAGGLRGVGDVADTLAQGIAKVGTSGANALQGAGIISPETAGSVQNWGAGVNDRVISNRNAFDSLGADSGLAQAGRMGGQVAGTAPFLMAGGAAMGAGNAIAANPLIGSALTGAVGGAATNALTSSASDAPLSSQIGEGALAGAALGPLGYGASKLGSGIRRAVFGATSPETAALADSAVNKYGIPVTAGQISSNPMVRFTDSVLQRIPLTGYGARTAEQQTGLNRAVAHEMGVASDVVTPDVVRQAKKTAYADYDAAKAQLNGPLNLDQKFYGDLHNIQTNSGYVLEKPLAERVDRLLNHVVDKLDTNNHTIDADLFQSLTRKNGPLDSAVNSRDSKISTYASEIKDALENMVSRNSQTLKKLKDEADYKYFVAKSVEPLANEATTGNISPAKLSRAVDFSHTDVGELGKIGQRFMKEPASSGTPERLLAMETLKTGLGAAGLGAAYAFDPENFQRNALIGGSAMLGGRAASSLLRSRMLTNALINSGLNRPGTGQPLSNLLARAAPLAALTYRPSNALTSQ